MVHYFSGRAVAAGMALVVIAFLTTTAAAAPIVIDFETEDDFNPGPATPLGNGQIIDTEFGNHFTISSLGAGGDHLGPTIFDSSDPGPNDAGADPDLLVNTGNILILQNPSFSANDGSFYSTPNDFASGEGTFVFDFFNPVELLSIDLVDINGGVMVDVTITDGGGKQRFYDVPVMWTNDIDAHGPDGYDTLDLTTLLDQDGEGSGGSAIASEDLGFDPTDAVKLELRYFGSSPSGGLDNLVFVPEPATMGLLAIGALATVRRRNR